VNLIILPQQVPNSAECISIYGILAMRTLKLSKLFVVPCFLCNRDVNAYFLGLLILCVGNISLYVLPWLLEQTRSKQRLTKVSL
jgi:uncharacterized membrane protein